MPSVEKGEVKGCYRGRRHALGVKAYQGKETKGRTTSILCY